MNTIEFRKGIPEGEGKKYLGKGLHPKMFKFWKEILLLFDLSLILWAFIGIIGIRYNYLLLLL